MSKYIFFWGHSGGDEKSQLSNFAYTPFTLNFGEQTTIPCNDCLEFTTGEQAFHYAKAILFGDKEKAQQILQTDDPRRQKRLGREVRSFDSGTWDDVSYEVMKFIVHNKIAQNPKLEKFILKSIEEGCQFVEASPLDRKWGIGYDAAHAMNNFKNWGTNWLGKIITEYKK